MIMQHGYPDAVRPYVMDGGRMGVYFAPYDVRTCEASKHCEQFYIAKVTIGWFFKNDKNLNRLKFS